MNSKESAELVELAKSQAGGGGRLLQRPLLPAEPGSARHGAPRRRRPDLTTSTAATRRTGSTTTPTTTGASWPSRAASCGPSPTSAPTGWTWSHSITGLEVEAVFADLKTVHPVRKRPKGEVQTYTGKTQAPIADGAGAHHHRGLRGRAVPLQGRRPGHACTSRRSRPAGRTACATRSPASSAPWPGTARRPTRCGSAAATRPNESLIRDPSLLAETAAALLHLSRRPQRRLPRRLQGLLPRLLRVHRRGRLLRPAALSHLRRRAPLDRAVRRHPEEPSRTAVGARGLEPSKV